MCRTCAAGAIDEAVYAEPSTVIICIHRMGARVARTWFLDPQPDARKKDPSGRTPTPRRELRRTGIKIGHHARHIHTKDAIGCFARKKKKKKGSGTLPYEAGGQLMDLDSGNRHAWASAAESVNGLNMSRRRIVCFNDDSPRDVKEAKGGK